MIFSRFHGTLSVAQKKQEVDCFLWNVEEAVVGGISL